MLKTKLYRKILIAGITGSLLISSGVVAFAATTKSSTTPSSKIACKVGTDKKDAFKDKTQQGKRLTLILEKEVTAGTITQAESDAITSYITTKEVEEKVAKSAEKAKVAAMTDAEKKTYFEVNKTTKGNMLSELVTAGIFSQAQADKIQAVMPQKSEMGKEHKGGAMKGTNSKGVASTAKKQ